MFLHLSYKNFHTICLEITIPCSKGTGSREQPTAVSVNTVLKIRPFRGITLEVRVNTSQNVFKAL